MYGYEEVNDITPEQVLQKITQEKIFEWLLGLPVRLDQRYMSPYRQDTRPGCWFEYREDGTLLFMDLSGRSPRRYSTCFGMLIQMSGHRMDMCIDIVCKNFKLSKNSNDYSAVLERPQYNKIEDSTPTIIQAEHRQFLKKDKIFWSQYLIRPDDLEEDNVHSVQRFFISSHKGRRWIQPFGLCYDINFINASEIYQPYNHNYKFITNCDENHIGNIDNLPPIGDKLIIEKSYKDHRSLRNLYKELNVIWFLNEGCVPSIHILHSLSSRFKEILIFYDNDEAGIQAGIKISSIFNSIRDNSCRLVALPVGPKNVSDLAKKEGRSDSIKILNKIL